MKKWKIEINAIDEKQASQILKAMMKTFKLASKHNLPMDSIFMETKGNRESSSCMYIRQE